ncbi:DNA-binding protein [Streptomyces sp. NBC_00249]|uniref:DNA-binding protein n=1 Tax=Streptomyces sp. NBC_00249 TaxID=2975690 RepID=UPI00225BBD30|nr:DNA-binding protein [Streptomyces sp. NBC_00249]MCX5193500.1 DNA-binding protein [Streptomyces sp. NBC_00249]
MTRRAPAGGPRPGPGRRPAVGPYGYGGDGGRGGDRDAAVLWALDAVERLVAVDATRGATAALPLVRETLRLLPGPQAAPDSLSGLGSDLLAALAELYEVIGWILFDAGRYRRAHRTNARALALAELCGDRWTARLVLLNHSMLAAHTGRPRAALEAASRVRGARPLPARVAGLVHVRQAHALALLGRRTEPLELISRAQSRFLDGISRRDPHWAWWIDQTELLGHRGWVQARLRRWDRAVPLLYEAATAPGPSYRHLFTAELLSALAGAGAWREARTLIESVAPRAAGIGSVRTTETLGRTAAALRRGPDVPPGLRDAAVFLQESLPG